MLHMKSGTRSVNYKDNIPNLISFGYKNFREDIQELNVNGSIRYLARQSDKRPAIFEVMVPDEWVTNIRGNESLVDHYVMLRIGRNVFDRMNSPIIIQ